MGFTSHFGDSADGYNTFFSNLAYNIIRHGALNIEMIETVQHLSLYGLFITVMYYFEIAAG